jgi:hypothetical protein
MNIKGTEVSFAHRDVQYATDAEIEKLTELVIEEQRYHHQHGDVVELVVETDSLDRHVRYQTTVNVEHKVMVAHQTAEFDEDRLRKMTG